ncbi:MAG: M28 family peptidase, partial [Myxococcota bacterium]
PRHGERQARENARIGEAIALELEGLGYATQLQGPHRNVVALPRDASRLLTLVCAHYDSVPTTPGADDNASAVAVMLSVARTRPADVGFVAFNREEDGMMGSTDFVQWLQTQPTLVFRQAHVLEMVGYTDPRPGAQQAPPPLTPEMLPRDTGDFISVVGLGAGYDLAGEVLRTAENTLGVPPVVTLQAPKDLLGWAPDLGMSDHLPFVQGGLPAVMWTDTAYFRTPHYHLPTDSPDTLDYTFMAEVEALLRASLVDAAR